MADYQGSWGNPINYDANDYSIRAKVNQDQNGQYLSVGYDYFLNGQPITEAEYAAAGMDLAGDQKRAQADPRFVQEVQDFYKTQDFGADTTTPPPTGATSTTPQLGTVVFNGKVYNLDDPTQKSDFFNDKLTELTLQRDQNIAAGRKQSDEQIRQLDQEILDTQQQAKDYVSDYFKNVNQFGEDYQLGNVKRQQYFAGLGANAFQSSQGDSALYANNKYIEGLGDMASEAQSNVGEGFQRDQNGPLGENSIFGRTIAEYNRQKQNVGNAFNTYIQDQNKWLNGQKDTLSGSFTPADAYKFAPTQVAAPTANKADVSPYTPYTQFTNPLGGTTPLSTGGKFFTNNAFTKDTSLNTFLGRNKLDTREKDRLSSYLLGRA